MCSRISHGVTVSAKRYRVRPLGGAPGSCSGRLGSDLLCVAAIGGDSRSRDQLRLRIPLAGAHERKIQQLQTAPRGGHHLHSLAFRSGVARNDLQCNARMIIIVLRMIAESLGGLRTHVHVLARAVLHEGFQQRACQVSGHALNGEAGRGDYLGERALRIDEPYPVDERLYVAQYRPLALGKGNHLGTLHSEALAHPDPVFGVGLLDTPETRIVRRISGLAVQRGHSSGDIFQEATASSPVRSGGNTVDVLCSSGSSGFRVELNDQND